MKRSFDSGKALSYVEYGKKFLPVAESYLIDDARREGGTRDGSKWDLKTLWTERPSKERNDMMYLGQSDEPVWQVGYKRLCSLTNSVSFEEKFKVNYPQQHCLLSFISLVSDTVFCGKHLFIREFATRRIHA